MKGIFDYIEKHKYGNRDIAQTYHNLVREIVLYRLMIDEMDDYTHGEKDLAFWEIDLLHEKTKDISARARANVEFLVECGWGGLEGIVPLYETFTGREWTRDLLKKYGDHTADAGAYLRDDYFLDLVLTPVEWEIAGDYLE